MPSIPKSQHTTPNPRSPNFKPTFNRLDISLKLPLPQPLRLEPVRQRQPPPHLQHPTRIPKEQPLIRKVTERLTNPNRIKRPLLARKELPHPLGIQLDKPNLALAQGPEPVGVRRHIRPGLLLGLGLGQPRGDLHLLARDGDARHSASQVGGEVARGAADAAADVEHVAAGGDARDVEEQADQVDLRGFLGVGGFGGVGGPVAVVDVFAPGMS